MDWVTVGHLEEFESGRGRVVEALGGAWMIAREGALVFAVQPRCPHCGRQWDGAEVSGATITCPRCWYQYRADTGLNPRTTACHVNQSTAECHYRNFPEGRAEVYDVRVTDAAVGVARTPRPFVKVVS